MGTENPGAKREIGEHRWKPAQTNNQHKQINRWKSAKNPSWVLLLTLPLLGSQHLDRHTGKDIVYYDTLD